MGAPTDTFLQSILQAVPEGAVPWIIAAFVTGIVVAAVLVGMADARLERKRQHMQYRALSDSQRHEKRPSGLENYR